MRASHSECFCLLAQLENHDTATEQKDSSVHMALNQLADGAS